LRWSVIKTGGTPYSARQRKLEKGRSMDENTAEMNKQIQRESMDDRVRKLKNPQAKELEWRAIVAKHMEQAKVDNEVERPREKPEWLQNWIDNNYHLIMLASMLVEIGLLILLVIEEWRH
jgi:hypothetical protein